MEGILDQGLSIHAFSDFRRLELRGVKHTYQNHPQVLQDIETKRVGSLSSFVT